MNPPEIAFRTRRLVPEAGEHLFNGCSLAGHRLPRPGHRGGKIDRVRCASAIALRYGSACHAILSSETKCNTPADLIIGTADQDLRECCHAMLFAFVG
jgi:hypothetical protein